MRVIIISQYFPPETGATQNRLASLARGFVKAGHEVVVLAQKPNYPDGIIWDDYRGRLFQEREYRGARVIHTSVLTFRSRSFISRIAYFVSFMVLAIFASFRLRGPYDIVIASSPPLFVGIAGWVVSRLRSARFLFDVRDLWPDIAVELGEMTNRLAIRFAKKLELFIYARTDAITAVTEGFCDQLRLAVPGKSVFHVSNGAELSDFIVAESKRSVRGTLNIPDGFVVGYIGNFGLAYDFSPVVRAAEIINELDQTIKFVFVGSGSSYLEFANNVARLSNVIVRPRVDLATAARYMAASDVLICPVRDFAFHSHTIPAKLFESMAAARPLLLSMNGEARRILEEAGAGWYYPAEDPRALVNAILDSKRNHDRLDEVGARGREFVEQHFSRSVQAARMVEIARDVAANNTPRPEQAAPSTGQSESIDAPDAPDEPRKQPHQQSAPSVRIASQAAPHP